jgi:hypothetical protein
MILNHNAPKGLHILQEADFARAGEDEIRARYSN